METKTKVIIGVLSVVVLVGSFCGYKYVTDWKFQDYDEKVEGGKVVSIYTKQDGWTPYTTKDMGIDQTAIDVRNAKSAKSANGVYRKGILI